MKAIRTPSPRPPAATGIALVVLGVACLAAAPRPVWAQSLRQPNQRTGDDASNRLEFAGMVFPTRQSLPEELQERGDFDHGFGHSQGLASFDSVEPDRRLRLAGHQISTRPAGPAPPEPTGPQSEGRPEVVPLRVESPFYAEADDSVCATEVEHRPITSLSTNIACSEGALPADCARAKFDAIAEASDPGKPLRTWDHVAYPWEASYLCHGPLYFEEINLERYGYMCCDHRSKAIPAAIVQPVLSGAHFFATVPILPYKMVVEPPCQCIYTLGHYRPGSSCVPYRIHRIPLRPAPGAVEAAVITGMVIAIP